MADYRRLVFSGNLQMSLIGLFIAFFVVFCCMSFPMAHLLSPVPLAVRGRPARSGGGMDELQLERQ